jgi:hypothetical protein
MLELLITLTYPMSALLNTLTSHSSVIEHMTSHSRVIEHPGLPFQRYWAHDIPFRRYWTSWPPIPALLSTWHPIPALLNILASHVSVIERRTSWHPIPTFCHAAVYPGSVAKILHMKIPAVHKIPSFLTSRCIYAECQEINAVTSWFKFTVTFLHAHVKSIVRFYCVANYAIGAL